MTHQANRRGVGRLFLVLVLVFGPLACSRDDGGHGHAHTPHDGVVAKFEGRSAHLELKLHDDKGDLELWLAEDPAMTRPLDLPVDAEIEVEFLDRGGQKVRLRVRDRETNSDEAGHPQIRDGRTNYFIFPTEPDEDASWLRGAEFRSRVTVRFSVGDEFFRSESFLLLPHTHGGLGHDEH